MNLTDLHRRLLADVLAVGDAYPLALTVGYAVQAHGLVDRLSQHLDVATENPDRMEDIAAVTSIISSRPRVSQIRCRRLPLIFSAPSRPRGPAPTTVSALTVRRAAPVLQPPGHLQQRPDPLSLGIRQIRVASRTRSVRSVASPNR